jgi:tripartite ATP-independent transporter DctM subunit
MTEAGYDVDFSAAITAASSIIGPVIPPSVMMVVYGYMSGASIARLFLGGFIPGLLMGGGLMLTVYYISKRRGYPVDPPARLSEIWTSFREAFLALLLPIILVGGILAGAFTPTEAAVIAADYALILALLIYKEVSWEELWQISVRVVLTSASILFLIAAAAPLGWALAWERVPQTLTQAVLSLTDNPILVLMLMNIVLLFLGCFLETTSIMILLIPITTPLMRQLGIDLVHFGVVMVVNLLVGTLTPPMGLGLFIMSQITDLSPFKVFRASLPFVGCLVVVLLLITYLPGVVLFLPRLVLG